MLIFGLSSVLSGREGWHYVLIFGLSSVLSGREDSKNELSSVSGREDLELRANICYPLFWQGRIGYPLFMQGRLA